MTKTFTTTVRKLWNVAQGNEMNGITDGTEFYALALFDTMPNGRAVYISIFAHRMDLLHICDAHDLLFIAMDLCVCVCLRPELTTLDKHKLTDSRRANLLGYWRVHAALFAASLCHNSAVHMPLLATGHRGTIESSLSKLSLVVGLCWIIVS